MLNHNTTFARALQEIFSAISKNQTFVNFDETAVRFPYFGVQWYKLPTMWANVPDMGVFWERYCGFKG